MILSLLKGTRNASVRKGSSGHSSRGKPQSFLNPSQILVLFLDFLHFYIFLCPFRVHMDLVFCFGTPGAAQHLCRPACLQDCSCSPADCRWRRASIQSRNARKVLRPLVSSGVSVPQSATWAVEKEQDPPGEAPPSSSTQRARQSNLHCRRASPGDAALPGSGRRLRLLERPQRFRSPHRRGE